MKLSQLIASTVDDRRSPERDARPGHVVGVEDDAGRGLAGDTTADRSQLDGGGVAALAVGGQLDVDLRAEVAGQTAGDGSGHRGCCRRRRSCRSGSGRPGRRRGTSRRGTRCRGSIRPRRWCRPGSSPRSHSSGGRSPPRADAVHVALEVAQSALSAQVAMLWSAFSSTSIAAPPSQSILPGVAARGGIDAHVADAGDDERIELDQLARARRDAVLVGRAAVDRDRCRSA